MPSKNYTGIRVSHDMTLAERLAHYSMPEPNSGCTLWFGPHKKGYGMLRFKRIKRGAHVWSWELHNGRPVPDGLFVCHRCDVPACINPLHLFVGTNFDNISDKIQKGRTARGKMLSDAIKANPNRAICRGETRPASKLTDDNVRAIRLDSRWQTEIAKDYGVSQTAIHYIKIGKSWKHVK